MHRRLIILFYLLSLFSCTGAAFAESAVTVLGKDYEFPNALEGMPTRLSDFKSLEINFFTTSDGVRLAYWEAGQGKPLVFIPAWSASGAEFVSVLYLLSKKYHVYVLDPRNQGLSQRVEYGNRISRYAMDLKEFADQEGLGPATYCGWSMGASILWSYIDLFGTKSINSCVIIDEPVSIYAHADWSEQERRDAGGMTSSPERMINAFVQGTPVSSLIVDMKVMERAAAMDSLYYANSRSFAETFIRNDPEYMKIILFDHITNDWRDVIRHKINVPTAIFTGEYSSNLLSQKWIQSVIPGSTLYVYGKADQGDHFLAFKNPYKFTSDLSAFLEK